MKTLKRLALGVMMGVLALALCSCDYLDQKKAQHAVLDNGVITFENHEYTSVGRSNYSLVVARDGYPSLYVCAPDVPLLLIGYYGTSSDVSSDGLVIAYGGELFVRDDATADVRAELANPKMDKYCTVSVTWDDQGNTSRTVVPFDDKAAAAIRAALATEPMEISTFYNSNATYQGFSFSVTDESCHLRGLSYDLYQGADNTLYVEDYLNDAMYTVPPQYTDALMSLFTVRPESTVVISGVDDTQEATIMNL